MSTNKTPLGLNNWNTSEKPVMTEFNSDNQIIDQQLRELSAKKLDMSETNRVRYVGNISQTIFDNMKYMTPYVGYISPVIAGGPQASSYLGIMYLPYSSDGHAFQLCWNLNGNTQLWWRNAITATWGPWRTFFHNGTALLPSIDNNYNLGSATNRFAQLFAGTATINTSDARDKINIIPLINVRDFLMSLEPVSFQFIDGSSKRTHHGLIAQSVEMSMKEAGMSSKDFAGFIKSPVYRETERIAGYEDFHIAEILAEDGETVLEPERIEKRPIMEEIPIEERKIVDYRYGLRYSEFIPMLIKMAQDQQKTIENLTTRIEILESKAN